MKGESCRQLGEKPARRKISHILYDYFWKYRYLHLLVLPSVIYFIVFKYIPMAGIVMAFKNYKGAAGGFAGIWNAEWVGFENFITFFKSANFGRVVGNTLKISLYRIIFGFPAPILLAVLINEITHHRFKKTVQTITYMPFFLSWAVVGGILTSLLSTDGGVVNTVLQMFSIRPISFMTDVKTFRSVLVVSDIWKNIGYNSIIYLAAIAGINEELYEAAKVDGATKFQQITHITLPALSEIIAVMLILSVGTILNDNFEQIYTLYSPAVYEVADTFETYTYRTGILNAQFSYTTAVSFLKSIIALFLVVFSNKIAKKLGSEGLL